MPKKNEKQTSAKAEKQTVAKAEKPVKRTPKEKVAMRTVALRVPEDEFQLLHKAAGERNLSNFMRTTLVAAANKVVAK